MACHVGLMSYPAFGYVDDLLLRIPRIHGLDMLGKTSKALLVNMA